MSDGSRRRRTSLSILRPSLSPLTPITEPSPDQPSTMQQKKRFTIPFQFNSSPLSASPASDGNNETEAPSPTTSLSSFKDVASKASKDRLLSKAISKGLQRPGRPTSLFGSLKTPQPVQDGDDNPLTRTTSTPTSTIAEKLNDISGSEVLHHGEIQNAGSMFRKKSQYFVLTDTHLIRFKSQSRASEIFSCIPSSLGRSSGLRHSRISSSGSLQELSSPSSSSENSFYATPLSQIVAVYRLDDGRPYFSVQISWLDEENMQSSETTLQLHDPSESDLWLSSIRGAAMKARLTNPLPFSRYLVEYTARALEQEQDYDPRQFHMFKIVQRATKASGRSSSDDLTKVTSNICILAIGIFKVHLIPLPKLSRALSSAPLIDMVGVSHGVTTLTALNLQLSDDAFTLTFRIPLRQPTIFCLASFCSSDIALWLRQAAEYLRPQWIEQPFTWNVPQNLEDEALPMPSPIDDAHLCLNRTLCAYCAAYDIDASRIRYEVNWHCEDAPSFDLQPPTSTPTDYSVLELLAVMRALRYNESFGCISFSDIKLDCLRDRYDHYGEDHVPWSTKAGIPLDVGDQSQFTLLIQEVQALASKSKRLRRLDFSRSLTNRPTQDLGADKEDPGCGICEALFPLCAKEYTNVDWIMLNGIVLKEVDLDYLYNATIDRKCHFRAIDMAYCGLTERSLDQVLHALSHQAPTLESIEISGNPARIESSWLKHVHSFEFMRKISLSNILRTSAPEPLIPASLLITWKLEEINFSNTPLNIETVEAIASYLSHPQSRYLRVLKLNRCQLTGNALADLLNAQHKGVTGVRHLELKVTGNWLEQGHEYLVTAISRNWTPTQMTMRNMYYKNEANFRALLSAFKSNQTTRHLDISKFSLPSDASEETCEALRGLFAANTTLEYLDISSVKTHIEAAGLGRGLYAALNGLKHNETLKVLKLHHQGLGLQGANALASVLEENRCLQELHCEDNEINLQGFTTLVNSMEHNTSILHLPSMDIDRGGSLRKMDREVQNLKDRSAPSSGNLAITKATVRKTLGRSIAAQKTSRMSEKSSILPDESLKRVVRSMSQNWDREVDRLQKYLDRNYALAHGLPLDNSSLVGLNRPGTSDTLTKALEDINFDDKTPRAELDLRLGHDLDETKGDNPQQITKDEADEGDETDKPLEIGRSSHE